MGTDDCEGVTLPDRLPEAEGTATGLCVAEGWLGSAVGAAEAVGEGLEEGLGVGEGLEERLGVPDCVADAVGVLDRVALAEAELQALLLGVAEAAGEEEALGGALAEAEALGLALPRLGVVSVGAGLAEGLGGALPVALLQAEEEGDAEGEEEGRGVWLLLREGCRESVARVVREAAAEALSSALPAALLLAVEDRHRVAEGERVGCTVWLLHGEGCRESVALAERLAALGLGLREAPPLALLQAVEDRHREGVGETEGRGERELHREGCKEGVAAALGLALAQAERWALGERRAEGLPEAVAVQD